MRKTFQIAALLVVALLSACSGGEEKKEGTQEEAAQLNMFAGPSGSKGGNSSPL